MLRFAKLERPNASTIAWICVFAALAAALAVMGGLDLLAASPLTINLVALGLVACAGVALLRIPLARAVARAGASRGLRLGTAGLVALRDAAALLVALACTVLALELPWNDRMNTIHVNVFWIEVALCAGILLALYFLGRRHGAAPALAVALACFCGLAQYFVLLFRDTVILPADLLAIKTAASVVGGYEYVLNDAALAGVAAAAGGLAACSLIVPVSAAPAAEPGAVAAEPGTSTVGPSPDKRHRRPPAWATDLLCGTAAAALVVAGVTLPDYKNDLGVDMYNWEPIYSYREEGLLTCMVYGFQQLGIRQPAGYTDALAQEVQDSYAARYQAQSSDARHAAAAAQFQELRPSIVFVMNESFSDLSVLDGLGVGYPGPEAFDALDDALVRGSLSVSAYGGGTCNSEFETLTGNSLAYIGDNKTPYTFYDLSRVQSLAKQLGGLGYQTTAIHPNLGTNWSRNKVYPALGFDEFLTIDDFKDAPQFHSGVTDQATYQAILDRLEASDQPQFFFDVTMQGHSGYDQNNISAYRVPTYRPSYLDEDDTAVLNEYLACVKAADKDLAWFVRQLRGLDRPVVLVFFGDHQPYFSDKINDALYPDEADEALHSARIHQTAYVVWANYDVAGTGTTRMQPASTSTLASVALDAVGAPLTTTQQALLGAWQDVPQINCYTYADADGSWHSVGIDDARGFAADLGDLGAGSAAERARRTYGNLAYMQYLEFAEKVR